MPAAFSRQVSLNGGESIGWLAGWLAEGEWHRIRDEMLASSPVCPHDEPPFSSSALHSTTIHGLQSR
jgi:hypothetical protein